MNESFAITIMNDILNNSNNDIDILERINKWSYLLNNNNNDFNDFNKLAIIYLSFIYEEIINNYSETKNNIKNEMKELLLFKEFDSEKGRTKAAIFSFIKYKKH